MLQTLITPSYSIFSNKGVFALLLGSGISRSAGIPTGWELMNSLIRDMAVLQGHDAGENPDIWYRTTFDKDPDYSDILEKLTTTPEERVNLLRPYFEPSTEEHNDGLKIPTVAHRQVAWLVKNGFIKVIITTNFDRLIETSLADVGIYPSIISNPSHVENVLPLVHSTATIIKINGDYLDTKFLNIKSELSGYDPRIRSLLAAIFENYGLLTCGWSAKWDVALVEEIKSANKFRFSSFFTHLSNPDSVMTLLSESRQGNLVQIKGGDEFFTEIVENIIALENSRNVHPLSARILLAQIKKYVSSNDFHIKLFDLIHQLTEQTANSLSKKEHRLSRSLIDGYKDDLELLTIALINSTYWSSVNHESIIIRSLVRIYQTSDITNYYANFRRFPAVILRYAIGIACIARENYTFLAKLCNLDVKSPTPILHTSLKFTDLTNQWQLIEKNFFTDYFSNNYYFPHSKFIERYLRPFFSELIPDDSNFMDSFYMYELITHMIHSENDPQYGYPVGSYLIEDSQYTKKRFIALLANGDKSILFTSGLFQRQDALVEKVENHYRERIVRLSH